MNNHLFQPLILASASPRRQDILKNANIPFEIRVPDIDESVMTNETPAQYALRMAEGKALKIARNIEAKRLVLAADTIVTLGSRIYGKPRSPQEAANYLSQLSGKTHQVITAYALIKAPEFIVHSECVISHVTMKEMSQTDIDDYVKTGEPMDKAGAYALQGIGGKLIEKVEGLESNVIGLPIEKIIPWLKKECPLP